jgi:tRNA U34 5-methylaminomethyl-2-thiouridine-forming methyltransferase MnmC
MDNLLRLCEDGSHTLYSEKVGECYHSVHGAYNESLHIFIDAGFRSVLKNIETKPADALMNPDLNVIRILEVGFGTGLNALLTAMISENEKISVSYLGLEPFPVEPEIIQQLNYCNLLSGNSSLIFKTMHESDWKKRLKIHSCFNFEKRKIEFMEAELAYNSFDLIYFDAFSPEAQPDLWEPEVFVKCFRVLAQDGILVTYCAKGRVKRALKAAGFTIENLPGPAGKREITRAHKLI